MPLLCYISSSPWLRIQLCDAIQYRVCETPPSTCCIQQPCSDDGTVNTMQSRHPCDVSIFIAYNDCALDQFLLYITLYSSITLWVNWRKYNVIDGWELGVSERGTQRQTCWPATISNFYSCCSWSFPTERYNVTGLAFANYCTLGDGIHSLNHVVDLCRGIVSFVRVLVAAWSQIMRFSCYWAVNGRIDTIARWLINKLNVSRSLGCSSGGSSSGRRRCWKDDAMIAVQVCTNARTHACTHTPHTYLGLPDISSR
jgi:hypothetical protein